MEYPSTAEYGDVKANDWPVSSYTVLDQRTGDNGRSYRLVQIGRGYECAGSAMRWCRGCFAVQFQLDGARHGRRFINRIDAIDHFHKQTNQFGN